MKHCPTCQRDLEEAAFWRDRSRPDGLCWECIDCKRPANRARAAAWYAVHAEYHKSACTQRRRERRAAASQ